MATQSLPSFRYTTRFAFQHVSNYDGTSDSICLRCHSPIASSHDESSLEEAERKLAYRGERDMIRRAQQYLRSHPEAFEDAASSAPR